MFLYIYGLCLLFMQFFILFTKNIFGMDPIFLGSALWRNFIFWTK